MTLYLSALGAIKLKRGLDPFRVVDRRPRFIGIGSVGIAGQIGLVGGNVIAILC